MKLLLLLVATAAVAITSAEDFLNVKVQRKINLQKHFCKIDSVITIKNTAGKPRSKVSLLPDPILKEQLSSFLVYLDGSSVWINPDTWEAQLPSAVGADEMIELTIEEIYTHVTTPLPETIKQTGDQLMTFKSNLHHFTPYPIRREMVTVTFPNKKVNQFSPEENLKKSGKNFQYGEYKDLPASSHAEFFAHYEANIPFLSTHFLFREIEVSHWGNVKVSDNADVRHQGAKLEGTFSRVQYSHDGGDDAQAVHWIPKLIAILPAAAKSIYYGDAIGTISTYKEKKHGDRVEVEMRPRTPLFGGWKSDYNLKYDLPSENALFFDKANPSRFTMKIKAIDHLYTDQVVDQVEIQVILPEGAEDIDVKVPAGYSRGHDLLKFTYLDITGRPVIVLRAQNLAGKSLDQELQLSYTFASGAIYREPLMTITAFFVIFVCVMFVVRLDFTIADDGSVDAKARIAAAFQKAQEANNSRLKAHDEYKQAISRYNMTKDLAVLTGSQKKYKFQAELFCGQLKEIQDEHKEAVAEKLNGVMAQAKGLSDAIQKGPSAWGKVQDIDKAIDQGLLSLEN